jgi:hypothetical protein
VLTRHVANCQGMEAEGHLQFFLPRSLSIFTIILA